MDILTNTTSKAIKKIPQPENPSFSLLAIISARKLWVRKYFFGVDYKSENKCCFENTKSRLSEGSNKRRSCNDVSTVYMYILRMSD